MTTREFGGPEFSPRTPNITRIYDYLLDGKDNFADDRFAAEQLLDAVPEARVAAKANRAFLGRAVCFLAEDCGIRQFIDIGTGPPTQGAVHEAAHEYASDARVLYVDYDPIVTAHARALLADNETVMAVNGDLRYPDGILEHPVRRMHIDLKQPVAVLLVAALHSITDEEDPQYLVGAFTNRIAPGSYLVVSHVTGDDVPADLQCRDRAEEMRWRAWPGMPDELKGSSYAC